MRKLSLLATAALVVAAGAASATAASPTAHPASRTTAITINNFAFSPQTLRIRRGTTVIVRNRDSTNHSFTSNSGRFELSNLTPGQSGRVRFARAGRYSYHCDFHPYMKGTVIVR